MTQANNTITNAYIPGVCNINRQEIASRRRFAYAGIILAIVLLAVLLASGANRWLRLVIFLPLLIGFSCMLQVKNKFCVGYAASGQQNAAEDSTTASKVTDSVDHAKDKAKASRMNRTAFAASFIVTLLLLVIPQ